MPGVDGKARNWSMRSRSAALAVLCAGVLTCGGSGCAALPALGAIPSLISMIHDLSSSKNESGDTTAPNPDAQAADAEPSTPPPKLTMENVCQMIAIAHPDLVVVELRKGATGAPEYRELRLVNSTDNAQWMPIVAGDTGPDGWRPAVNFLKMDFKPPLTAAVPDSGTSYLAYVPLAANPNDPQQAAQLQSAFEGQGQLGAFTWDGRVYEYTVASSLPCLPPSS
jgi:hypothetical protein